MVQASLPKPKNRQLWKLFQEVFGPPETWDEATEDLILEIHGIDPGQSKARFKESIDKMIQGKEDRGESVADDLRELRSFLSRDEQM